METSTLSKNLTFSPGTIWNDSNNFEMDICQFDAQEDYICQAALFIRSVLLPIIVAAGLFGNFFNFIIMMTPANRQMTYCLFFAALSVSDNIVLLGSIIHLVKENTALDQLTGSKCCSAYAFSLNVGSSCSAYFIVFITFLKFNALCNIFKRQREITRKTALIWILVITFTSVILNMPVIFTANLLNQTACVSYFQFKMFSRVWVYVVTVLFFVIPVALVTYWNIRIYYKLNKRGKGTMDSTQSNSVPMPLFRIGSSENHTSQQDLVGSSNDCSSRNQDSGISSNVSNKDTERKVSKMILLISAAFVFLCLPQYLRHVILLNLQRIEVKFLISNITNTLFNVNHAINFYLYCLSGAKFRNDFLNILKIPCKWMKK